MVQILVSLYFNTKYKDMKKLIDYNPFEDLTNEDVQYWLGWLASDGCVVGNRISLSVQRRDRDILEKLKDIPTRFAVIGKVIEKKEKYLIVE